MKKYLKVILVAVLVIGIVLVTGVAIIMYPAFPHNKEKAEAVAVEYLSEKYKQEMIYDETRVSCLVDPLLYHVYFAPADNRDMFFEVLVNAEFQLASGENQELSADNYLSEKLECELEEQLKPQVKTLWENAPSVFVICNSGIYAYPIPQNLSEDSTREELSAGIPHYLILSNGDKELLAEDINEEIERMISFVSELQKGEYSFTEVRFVYADKSVTFKNWQELKTMTEFMEVIHAQTSAEE